MDRETGYVDDELCWDCNMRPISTSQHLCDMCFAAWEWERMEREAEDDDDGPWGGGFADNH